MYMLPVTARFLTDVSLKVNFGEIHGIIGASGSGKSTLLQVISHRVDGKVTGDIKLNGELLTESNFTKLCKFVNFNIDLLPYLSVEQTIKYHAQICLSCTVAVLGQRISMLMQKFDLLSYVHRRVDQLTPSARYRLIMVLNLLGDPLLVLLDDPLTKLDALSNYQLMSSLREYVKENSRMALVTMRYPRSDIYQLIDGLTLLFYGEIVYSGPTKFMPHYFSQIGYKCPITENPAVYYLSLATVDRENPESYAETQEKATELVETFKKRRDNFDFSSYQPKTPSDSPILSNYYGQPSFFKHLYLLSLRNINLMLRSWPFMMTQTLYFAIFLFVAIFGGHFYTTTKHTPLSASGTLFSLVYFTAVVTVFATVINFKSSRSFMFWEVSNALYNAALIPITTLLSTLPIDLFVLTVSSTTFMWILQAYCIGFIFIYKTRSYCNCNINYGSWNLQHFVIGFSEILPILQLNQRGTTVFIEPMPRTLC
uniref:ABC transporter domain-containing protein n=1 Tax=Bursaphelenchus xylophilus TaxID=6326 RepID=A0A1I7RQ04_BURXY